VPEAVSRKLSGSALRTLTAVLLLSVLLPVFVSASDRPLPDRSLQDRRLSKTSVDDYVHYTTVGQIGMTVTNFGLLGEGYNNPDQPSCMYRQYPDNIKEQIEHFSYSGLWIGGIVNGEKHVSTAIVDGVFDYAAEGFEFVSNGDSVRVRSSILTSPVFDTLAVSHQDLIARFHDRKDVVEHTPMGLDIVLETYAWNYSFADAFVILNYAIINNGTAPIENIYAGIWADASIGNMNYTNIYEPGGGWSWYDNLNGFDQTVFDPVKTDDLEGIPRDIAYQFDADGDNGYSESYLGISVLGASQPREYWNSHFNQWPWVTLSDLTYPELVMPVDDAQRYDKLKSTQPIRPGFTGYSSEGFPTETRSWMMLLSAGPFGSVQNDLDSTLWTLPVGDTVNVVFAVGAGFWANSTLTNDPARRAILQGNLDWAQKAYNGEDSNGNGRLDPDEDQDGDGELDRYILPVPPPSPQLKIIAGRSRAELYWNNSPEAFEDPISREEDFEGYRIYARRKSSSVTNEWSLLAQFDKKNEFGYNTGLDYVRIKDDMGNPSFTVIEGDTFHYKFTNTGIMNGWPDKNTYAVTSYDTGDPKTDLQSLESSILENMTFVIAGEQAAEGNDWQPAVYPNPYRSSAVWDGSDVRSRLIWFTGLPAKSKIRIYTLAGELLDVIEHDASTYSGGDVDRLKALSARNPVMSGGEHAWDLITSYDQAIATGLYLFSVEDLQSGVVKTGRFMVIK